MKIAAFEVRDWEEKYFQEAAASGKYDLRLDAGQLDAEAAAALNGVEAVSVLDSVLGKKVLDRLKERGVRFITTRTIGYEKIDVAYAKSIGLRAANAGYPPEGVAEFTVMLMLLSLRHYKASLYRLATNDYSLKGLLGKELGGLTVGVAGAGGIGAAVIRLLSGFGCKILVHNRSRRPEIERLAEYVSLEELFARSDLVTFHMPLTDETRHMVNDESLARMKNGVVLINTARGELLRTETLIAGIESQKIGALGLDVFEGEQGIYHRYRATDIITNRNMAYLRQFPNVVMTQHMAFFTEGDIRSMVCGSLENLLVMRSGGKAREL